MKVLKFYADWCGPCQMLGKTIESSNLQTQFESIDIDLNSEIARQYNIRGVPTLVMVDESGNEVRRMSGYLNPTQLKQFVGE